MRKRYGFSRECIWSIQASMGGQSLPSLARLMWRLLSMMLPNLLPVRALESRTPGSVALTSRRFRARLATER
jgi:hypothetical protein